nr:MAG TPA: Survival motor neuron protein-beta protein, RNA metabolism, spliceosomes.0A [Caudoviricetes sp.]
MSSKLLEEVWMNDDLLIKAYNNGYKTILT